MHEPAGVHRPNRCTHQFAAISRADQDAQLVDLVLRASGGNDAELDEQYLLRAYLVQRDSGTAPIVVELVDYGRRPNGNRWQVLAHDEFSGAATQLGRGPTAEAALGSLDWQSLDRPADV